jgi:hypothetical protein
MHDALEVFSDAQDLAQVVGAYLSTKSIDMWNGARQTTPLGNTPVLDWGRGNEIQVECAVSTTFVGATATMIAELVMADDAALTSNLVSLAQSPGGSITVGIPVATLVQGYRWRVAGKLPVGLSKRYLGMRYNIYTATMTAGNIDAYLCKDKSTAPGTFS